MLLDDAPQTPVDGGAASDDGMTAGAGEDIGEVAETKDKADDGDNEEGGAAM